MESLRQRDESETNSSSLAQQAVSFFLHTVLALCIWLALMMVGYEINPPAVSQSVILVFSLSVPLLVGYILNRFRQEEMPTLVWLVGLIWVLVMSLWILDMPTGPNACFQCDATAKLSRTFFSLPQPSGLIDDDGPFLITWPAAALLGYSIGAKLALRRRPAS